MYIAQTTTSNNDKIIAGIVTSFVLLASYFALQWTDLPEVRQKTDTYEEINWTRFKPKPEKVTPAPKADKPVEIEQPVEFEPPPEPSRPAPATKIDLTALNAELTTLAKPGKSLSQRNLESKPVSGAKQSSSRLNLQKSTVLSGLNSLTGDSKQRLRLPGRGRGGRSKSGATEISVGSGSTLEPGAGKDLSAGGLTLGAPQAKEMDAGAIEIGMVDMSGVAGEFEDLSPIYRPLVEWMQRNPAQFPDVVNRFMEKGAGDLTSKVTFRIGGREFEMFLLCKQKLYEIRICLVEGNESTYLIDRGFKENSRFLRIGQANRTPTGDILSFSTSRRAASDSRTEEFYQIFLSWWESVK